MADIQSKRVYSLEEIVENGKNVPQSFLSRNIFSK
jgi:hypothetical protein